MTKNISIRPMFNVIDQNTFKLKTGSLPSSLNPRVNLSRASITLAFLTCVINWQHAEAQTFDQASNAELQNICNNQINSVGNQLGDICVLLPSNQAGGVTSASSGAGSQSQPNSFLISQQQLKDARSKKDKKKLTSSSSDAVAATWGKFSTFLTAGATTLRHRENIYEQGYTATIPSVTLGGSYLVSDTFETGVAFNYYNSNAVNTTGGGFNIDSYTPLLYVNYLPFDNAFINLALGYTRQDQTNDRTAVAGINKFTNNIISKSTKGNLNANQYTLNFLSGYDHPIENITIGPRIGVNVRQWEMNAYQESTNSGLELRYANQYQSSIQSVLGLYISSAHSTAYGVVVPQLTASWVHEYANGSRTVTAQFVQAPSSSGFSFQTENPARNWAAIDLGVSFVMPNNIQAFANFSTVQGNRNFENYGGNLGLRVGW